MKRKKVEAGKTYVGVVEDNQDPKREGRVKVRVVDVFENVPVEDIPWATPWKDLSGSQFALPEKGKVVVVVFEQADEYKPEYIFTDHFNVNLENKLKGLSDSDYLSMKSLIFDHKTQIFSNDTEGLKLDHKFNNINIKENSINLNLKDNNMSVNIGDSASNQQVILGTNFFKWFDEFVDQLMTQPYLGVIPNPTFIKTLLRYKAEKSSKFLSHHVNVVDNNQVSTVKSETRQSESQVGDTWNSTKEENTITTTTGEDYSPTEGEKKPYDDTYKAPPAEAGLTTDVKPEPTVDKLPDPTTTQSNKDIDRIVKFLQKKQYKIFEENWILNIVAFRSTDSQVSNVFDDELHVFYKNGSGNWEINKYQITTVPGLVPKTEYLPNNVAVLRLGQYVDQLKMGLHQNDPNHKSLIFDNCAIHKNNNTKKFDFTSPSEIGPFPISIHRTSEVSSAEYVFNYSEGDQVFKFTNQFDQFMTICQKQIDEGKRDRFSYTLCSKREFDETIVISQDEVKVNQFEKYLPKPKQQKIVEEKVEKLKETKGTDKSNDIKDKITKEKESYKLYKQIVLGIQKIYRLKDNYDNGRPAFSDFKGTFNDDEDGAIKRLREILGLVTTNKDKTWYGKLSISKLTGEQKSLFISEFKDLVTATKNGDNTINFLLPSRYDWGEGLDVSGSDYVKITPDF
jgi:hypothetical protein